MVSASHMKPLHVLAAPLSIQPPAYGLKGQQRMAQVLGSMNPQGKLREGSMLLASDRPSSGHCGHLREEPADEKSLSPTLLLSVNSIFQIKVK